MQNLTPIGATAAEISVAGQSLESLTVTFIGVSYVRPRVTSTCFMGINTPTNTPIDIDRHTDRQTYRQTDIQTDRQTDSTQTEWTASHTDSVQSLSLSTTVNYVPHLCACCVMLWANV